MEELESLSPEEVAAVFGGGRSRTPRPTSLGRKDIGSATQEVNQLVQSAPDRPLEEIRQDLALRLLTTDLEAKLLDATEADARLGWPAITSRSPPMRMFFTDGSSLNVAPPWTSHGAGIGRAIYFTALAAPSSTTISSSNAL